SGITSVRTGGRRPLHSRPTRRSSDLGTQRQVTHLETRQGAGPVYRNPVQDHRPATAAGGRQGSIFPPGYSWAISGGHWRCTVRRSEEHTSELQSRENLVCRLLLERKR